MTKNLQRPELSKFFISSYFQIKIFITFFQFSWPASDIRHRKWYFEYRPQADSNLDVCCLSLISPLVLDFFSIEQSSWNPIENRGQSVLVLFKWTQWEIVLGKKNKRKKYRARLNPKSARLVPFQFSLLLCEIWLPKLAYLRAHKCAEFDLLGQKKTAPPQPWLH